MSKSKLKVKQARAIARQITKFINEEAGTEIVSSEHEIIFHLENENEFDCDTLVDLTADMLDIAVLSHKEVIAQLVGEHTQELEASTETASTEIKIDVPVAKK